MNEKKKLKKIFNFRPLFFIFIIGCLCIYFSFILTNSSFNLFFFIVPVAFLIFVAVKKRFALLVFSAIFFLSSSLFTYFFISNYGDKSFSNTQVAITAKIEKITEVNDNFYYLTLTNATVVLENITTSTLDGNVSVGVNVYDTQYFDLLPKSQIAFSARISNINIKDENGNLDTFFLKWNIKYETNSINYTSITFLKDDSNFIEKFQNYNKTLLVSNLGETKGNLVFSILYGDRSSTSSEISDLFSFAGVIHLLSVSGLHVGLIVLLLIFLLNKTQLKEYMKFIIVFCFLLSFCTLCSFSSPVLRSSIMALIVLLAGLFKRKNDLLNSISLAGILILLFKPTSVFDLGFQMSFASVFGIILIAFSAKFVIKNKKLYNFLLPILATVSAELMILPILATYYGFVPTWSILFNLIVLPIFSLMYSLFFVTNIIVLIFPFMSFLYFIPKSLLDIILYIVSLVNLLPANTILTPKIDLTSTILFYFTFLILSKYFVLYISHKTLFASTLLFIFFLTVLLGALPATSSQNIFTFYEEGSSIGTIFSTKQSKYYLIEPNLNNSKEIADELENKKISKLSGIIMLTNSNFESTKVFRYLQKFSPKFYLPKDNIHKTGLLSLGFEVVSDNEQKNVIDDFFAIKYFSFEHSPFALSLEIHSKRIIFFKQNTLFTSYIKNFLSTNFDYNINCARMFQSDCVTEWKNEIEAETYFFNSGQKQQFLVA